jgi:hypothetical protein
MEWRYADSTGDLHEGDMAMVIVWPRSPRALASDLFFDRRVTAITKDFCQAMAIMAVLVILPVWISTSAESAAPTEPELKAAFLYNFIKFTEWPTSDLGKSESFIIGILGKDPFGAALDQVIEGETVHGKAILVRRFTKVEDAADSHVLFIGSSEENNLPMILRVIVGQDILTVSELKNFAQRGGVINLKKDNSKIVFEINLEAAKRANLTMSAQFLKLAKIVKSAS